MIQKRKLAYFLHDIAIGGAEIAFLSALPELHQRFDLKVFVLGNADSKLLERLADPIRQDIVCLNIPRWALIFHLFRIYSRLKSFEPEILISSLWRSTIPAVLYKWLNRTRVTYFVLMHSNGFFHRADRFFTRQAIRIGDAVFADARATMEFASTLVGKRKIPIVTLSYLTNPTSEGMALHDYNGQKKFCYLGKLNSIKRVDLAISVIAWLRSQGVDATLAVFGRDEGAGANISAQIDRLGLQQQVQIHSEVSPVDKQAIFRSFPFYIQLSAQEGMAMSVAEAMQNGLVCVVTAVGEIGNYAKDGVSAVLLDPTTAESWEESLDKLLNVLKSEEMCRSISNSAYQVFKGAPVFSESLVAAINQFTK